MAGFLATRLLRTVLTIWLIVTAVFFATRLTGDVLDFLLPEGVDAEGRQAMIRYLGLDRSYWVQYGRYFIALADGEFGLSLFERRPVAEIFAERIWPSVSLLLATFALTVAVGVPLGVFVALKRDTALGTGVMAATFLGYATPNFVLAILLLLIFSYSLNWLPSTGSATLAHYVMPTAALASFFIASLVRYTRNAMLDVLSQDFMRTARAKGLPERAVVFRHGLRNALIPVITVLGLQLTTLVSGAVVIETVFAWRGVGDLLVASTLKRDYPVLQFGVIAVAGAVVLVNLLVDLLYAAVDPRVRLQNA